MIELALRIVFSLVVVLLLMWGLARVARRPLAGRASAALAVLARQPLTRGASVQVVRLGERALVLGVTDQQVTLLAETDPALLEGVTRGEVREPVPVEALSLEPGARDVLGGSALSPGTWRQAAAALRKGFRP
jgi:flagellar protein FliO/FliZ